MFKENKTILSKVFDCILQQYGIVFKKTETKITFLAKQSSYLSALMTMINVELLNAKCFLANGATIFLVLNHLVKIVNCYSIINQKIIIFFIFCHYISFFVSSCVSFVVLFSTNFTFSIVTILFGSIFQEIENWQNRLTARTSFFRYFRYFGSISQRVHIKLFFLLNTFNTLTKESISRSIVFVKLCKQFFFTAIRTNFSYNYLSHFVFSTIENILVRTCVNVRAFTKSAFILNKKALFFNRLKAKHSLCNL